MLNLCLCLLIIDYLLSPCLAKRTVLLICFSISLLKNSLLSVLCVLFSAISAGPREELYARYVKVASGDGESKEEGKASKARVREEEKIGNGFWLDVFVL